MLKEAMIEKFDYLCTVNHSLNVAFLGGRMDACGFKTSITVTPVFDLASVL